MGEGALLERCDVNSAFRLLVHRGLRSGWCFLLSWVAPSFVQHFSTFLKLHLQVQSGSGNVTHYLVFLFAGTSNSDN